MNNQIKINNDVAEKEKRYAEFKGRIRKEEEERLSKFDPGIWDLDFFADEDEAIVPPKIIEKREFPSADDIQEIGREKIRLKRVEESAIEIPLPRNFDNIPVGGNSEIHTNTKVIYNIFPTTKLEENQSKEGNNNQIAAFHAATSTSVSVLSSSNLLQSKPTPLQPSSKCVGEIFLSANPTITIPLHAPDLVTMIMKHESLSASCPLDYKTSDGRTVLYCDPKKKEGRFNITRDSEMCLIFLNKIWQKDLNYTPEGGYQEIHSRQFKNTDERYVHFLNWMNRNGLLEIHNSYSDGREYYDLDGNLMKPDNYSKSYRWPSTITQVEEYTLKDKFSIRKFVKPKPKDKKAPVHYAKTISTLQNKIDSLEVDIEGASKLVIQDFHEWNRKHPDDMMEEKSLTISLERIKRLSDIQAVRESFSRPLNTTRVYSPLTSIPRCVKGKGGIPNKLIRLNGEPTLELDIECSQVAILWKIFNSWNPTEDDLIHFRGIDIQTLKSKISEESKKMYEWITSNQKMTYKVKGERKTERFDFYNRLRVEFIKQETKKNVWTTEEKENFTRDKMKVMTYNFMFSKSFYKIIPELRDLIIKEFPILFNFVFGKLKAEGKPLWRELSKIESGIVIDQIAMEISEMDFDVFTCHDSIRFPASRLKQVKAVWDRVLAENEIPRPM